MTANLFLRNREFLSGIRNAAYLRARECFRGTQTVFPVETSPGRELLRSLDAMLVELEAAFEYASDAIRGLRRHRVQRYRHDAEHGVLGEEVVLCHFLEEMITLTRFLRKRVETDVKMRLYRKRLHRLQSQSAESDGFLQGILNSLGSMAEEETSDLKRILDLMERRYQVGDRLMEVLRSKAGENRKTLASTPVF